MIAQAQDQDDSYHCARVIPDSCRLVWRMLVLGDSRPIHLQQNVNWKLKAFFNVTMYERKFIYELQPPGSSQPTPAGKTWPKVIFYSERTSKSAAVRTYAPKISTNGFTINHYIIMSDLSNHIFLKAHDPNNPLALIDDKDNDKYTHKYTHTKIHKLEVLKRPIMCYNL